jgi:simple sugar transport system ATP-binding protein
MFGGRVVAEMARGWHDHDLVAAMEGMADGIAGDALAGTTGTEDGMESDA